jgi:hypothetical protein
MEVKTMDSGGRKIVYTELVTEWEGKEEPIKIKKLSFGEMLDLNQMSAKMSMVGGIAKFDLDQKVMSENCLLKSIILAPFPINIQSIRDLPNELGQELVSLFNELNTPTDKKKEA